ncbi:MAG: SDR family NAD(P)-dependent oxidoreductase [Flavobacteriales bacterium]|nr:SDR family NAD(P)-dependent oxidoreductase [Flavobacteriales bacterium]
MIVLGSTSDISQAFIEKSLKSGDKYHKIYLVTSNQETTEKLARHLYVKYQQECEVIPFDLINDSDFSVFDSVDSELLFCATGYLGKNTEEGLYDIENSKKIIDINYAKLLPLLNYFAEKFEKKASGTIIALSSVAGERGRQSNFMYGSAKAGFTAYLQGLRNYLFHKGVHVLTIIPGFMDTKMTAGLDLPKPVTSTPEKAGNLIYKAYKKKKNSVYVLPIWCLIMLLIRNIPEFIFKKMKM